MWLKDSADCNEAELSRWTKEDAERGDPVSQFLHAKRLTDPQEKAYWLRKSAEQGFSRAAGELGSHYFDNEDVNAIVNKSEARYWLEVSASLQEPVSIYNLGLMEIKNNNFTAALSHFYKAASLGVPMAAFNMGVAYYNGYAVEKGL